MALLALAVVGISLLHYLTPLGLPMLHDIFQRLYYIPIILAAFWFGFRGGIISAIAVSIFYAPHILFQWEVRPSLELEKFLEIVLYNVVGGITGLLSQRGESRRRQLQETAQGLEESYHKLQSQADLVIQIEEQLRRAERLSALGELSAALAHEIRNPLGSIRGTAEILKDDFKAGDKKYEFLEILIKETDRLNQVVEDFLRLAKPIQVEKKLCDLTAELKEVVALVHAEGRKRGISVEFEPTKVPPVPGDCKQLKQVFLNLILNGIQASARGGKVLVAIAQRQQGDASFVEISFADTGSGIDPAVLPRIFEPFFTTKTGGTGLGLAITQRIIESHGGTIQVESQVGKGSTFVVRLHL